MKLVLGRFQMLVVLSLLFTVAVAGKNPDVEKRRPSVRIMTYNIRYDNPGDGINSWENRKQFVTLLMRFHGADIICIQEGLVQQVRYLHDALEGFSYCGKGRDDGKEEGEFSAIFFRKEMFDLLADSTFWLSTTPSRPSKGWDAALPRIATWAHFRIKESGQTFFVFNTHFDHMGEIARRESARLLLSQISRIARHEPAVLTGDFNSTEQDSAYKILLQPFLGAPVLRDSYQISRIPHFGVTPTFFGFDVRTREPGERIDFIFVSGKVEVLRHGTLSDFQDGRFPSDHLPVFVELKLGD